MKAGTGARGSGMGRIRIRQAIEWGLGLLVVLGIVGYIAVPSMQQVVNRAASTGITTVQRMLNPRLEPVRPTEFEASGQLDEHGIEKLFDKYANTDWRASGGQPTVMVRFAEPFDLGALIVYSGASQKFTETRRPAKLELTFPDGSATVIDLKDDNVKQEITVDKSGIDGFELKVLESYGPPDAPVTISEIEVFARR